MSYADFLQSDRRLVILRILAELPGYRGNSSVIASLLERFGHAVSRDNVKSELRFLADVGALALVEAGAVLVATLSSRGEDVVKGRIVIDGIAKPSA